jgi:chorismate mutase
MAVKQTGKKVYKTMQGKTIDMDLLRKRNELTPAVGNAKVNARGDELGPGGKIIKKREDVLADYYRDNPNTVAHKEKNPAPVADPVVEEPVAETPVEQTDGEWVEDAEGNFVKKEQ